MNNAARVEQHDPREKVALLARNAMHLGMAQVVTTILAIVLAAVIARSLGAKDFGLYYTITTVQVLTLVIVDWGQGNYVVRETARGRDDEPTFVSSAIVFRIVSLSATVLVAAAIALIAGRDDPFLLLVPLAILVMFPGNITQPIGYLFRGKDRMDLDALVLVLGRALVLVGTLIALGLGGGLTAVVLAQGLSGAGILLAHLYMARKLSFEIVPPAVASLRELFISGAPLAAFALTLALQPFIDVLILSARADTHVVGWFGAARTIYGTIVSPAAILAMASFPELSRASRSPEELRRLLIATARPLLAASACACAGLYVFADQIVTILYGHGDFSNTAQVLRTASPVLPILFLNFLIGATVTAIGKTVALATMKVINIVVASGIAWFAIGFCQTRFGNGAIGSMIGFSLAEVLMMGLLLALLPRAVMSFRTALDLFRAYLVAACTALPFFAVSPLPLWLAVPCFLAVFTGLAFAFRILSVSDLRRLYDALRKRAAVPEGQS